MKIRFFSFFLPLVVTFTNAWGFNLLFPQNNASKVHVETTYFTWEEVEEPAGGTVMYDLYFGKTPDPALYAENIYDGYENGNSLAFSYQDAAVLALVYMEFISFLEPEETYYWKVVAKLSDGTKVSSTVNKFKVARVNQLPSAPKMTYPINYSTNITYQNLTFQWVESIDNDGDEVTYNLYLGENTSNLLLEASGLKGNSYTLQKLLGDQTTYVWRIEAVDGYDSTIVNHVEYITYPAFTFAVENYVNDAPSVVSLVSPANNSTNIGKTIAFDWTNATDKDWDAINYYIYIDTDPNPATLAGIVSGTSSLNYTVEDAYKTYYWKVLAYDGKLFSTSSDIRSFKPYELPATPTLTLADGAANVSKRPVLQWTSASPNPEEIILYDVYLDKDPSPKTIVSSDLRSNAFSPVLTDASATYYWKVVAKTQWGDQLETPVRSFTPWKNSSNLNIAMVDVAGGSFKMGFEPYRKTLPGFESWGLLALDGMVPQHTVFLDSLSIGKYEITYDQFLKFLQATSSSWHINVATNELIYDMPVLSKWVNGVPSVSSQVPLCYVKADASAFDFTKHSKLIWNGTQLSIKEGFGQYPANWISPYGAILFADWADLRLPTEAEWEFAASGGNLSKNYSYSGSNIAIECAWYLWGDVNYGNPMTGSNNGVPAQNNKGTNVVGLKKANELGIHDMTGNVAEYCTDYYDLRHYYDTDMYNPLGPITFSSPVCRGGAFDDIEINLFNKARTSTNPILYFNGRGIRPAGGYSDSQNFLVHGIIVNEHGEPLEGVTLICGSKRATTNKHGRYQFRLKKGENVNIVPGHTDFSFSPSALTLQNINEFTTNLNFKGYFDRDYTISGKVTNSSGTGISGVYIGGLPKEIYTNSKGEFLARVPKGKDYTLTPQLLGYSFSPVNTTLANVQEDVNVNSLGEYKGAVIISGRVIRGASGQGETGVLIDGFPGLKVYTDYNGDYWVQVTKGWSGKIIPIEDSFYSFGITDPLSVTITNVVQNTIKDFNYTPVTGRLFTGKVIDKNGKPLEGIEIYGFDNKVYATNSVGIFGVEAGKGAIKTIYPKHKDYTFTPASLDIFVTDDVTPNTTAIFVANPPGDYMISGIVKNNDGTPMQSVKIEGLGKTVETNLNGEYSAWLNAGFSGTIRPQITGYSFSPKDANISMLNKDLVINFTTQQQQSFTISGKVTDPQNTPLANVKLNGFNTSVTTDANGEYTTKENEGWIGTITPQLIGYTFTPTNRVVSNLSANSLTNNFTGTPTAIPSYTISGIVRDGNGNPLPNVTLSGFTSTVTTNSNGEYLATEASGWSGTYTAQLAGYTFTPASKTITALNANLIHDFAATTQTFNISGKIVDAKGAPLANVLLTGFNNPVSTTSNGDYSTTEIYGWNGTITPELEGYSFDPPFRKVSALSDNLNFDFTASFVTGINDAQKNAPCKVYPNPSSNGELNIELLVKENATIQIYNILGEMVYTTQASKFQKISLKEKGMFTVRIWSADFIYIQKIIMN